MSLTEVYTDTREGRGKPRTASSGSLSLRARSPRPLQPFDDVSKGGDIELAEIDVTQGLSHSVDADGRKSSPAPSPLSDPPNLKVASWKTHLQFATLCFTLFLAGWNDGTTGPLLPRIQSNYHVGSICLELLAILD